MRTTKIVNIIGDKGPNFVAQDAFLNQPGQKPEIFIEKLFEGFALSHGVGQVTDSMAVIDLFMRIDKSLQNKPIADMLEQFNPVFKAAAAAAAAAENDAQTLENLVNALGNLYQVGKKVSIDERGQLYKRILN